MNSAGGTSPRLGWRQRTQGLRADDGAGPEVDLGLVVEQELVALQGAPQLAQQHEAARVVGVALGAVDDGRRCAASWRPAWPGRPCAGAAPAPCPWAGATAMPMLAPISMGSRSTMIGLLQGLQDLPPPPAGRAPRRRRGGSARTRRPADGPRGPPPPGRRPGARATSWITRSPFWWPRVLFDLAEAVQVHEQERQRPLLAVRPQGQLLSSRCWSSVRLGRPVSAVVVGQVAERLGRPAAAPSRPPRTAHEAGAPLGRRL